WAQAVAAAAARWGAERVVAESNMGGEMVLEVLRAAEVTLPVKAVRARVGKARRAEPVALAYERGEVVHAGVFASLEDELCGLQVGGGYAGPGRSPDRADACVWALAELLRGLGKGKGPGVRRV
ncbi:MAG TPA: ATP-binding protein, partial [Sphingopyxis sp.]|nr:ATP-binding protein [Sphingopyxis sp.]